MLFNFFSFLSLSLDIVSSGSSRFTIVIPTKDTPQKTYKHASLEIQNYVFEITGFNITIINDSRPATENMIFIGESKHSLVFNDFSKSKLEDDDFHLKTNSNHLFIVGGKRGVFYGIYEILERFCGCRWYTSYYRVIPKSSTFSVPQLDEIQRPAFKERCLYWYDWMMENASKVAIQNKLNGANNRIPGYMGGSVYHGSGLACHTFERLCPSTKYFATKPELFSLIKGKRKNWPTQLCLSNPEVLTILVQNLLVLIEKDQGGEFYSVSQNDYILPCECDECQKIKDQYGGTESGILIWFVNKVTEQVVKVFPKAKIETFAYAYSAAPPENIIAHPNVVIRYAPYYLNRFLTINETNYTENVKFIADLEKWNKITKTISFWDYTAGFWANLGCYPNFEALQNNAKFLYEHYVKYYFDEGCGEGGHSDFSELKAYLHAKVLWNPYIDTQKVIDDFVVGFYGKGAPYVQSIIKEYNSLARVGIYDEYLEKGRWMNNDFLLRCLDLWRKAEEIETNPIYLNHIRTSSISAFYTLWVLNKYRYSNMKCNDQKCVFTSTPDMEYLLQEIYRRSNESPLAINPSLTTEKAKLQLYEIEGFGKGFPVTKIQSGLAEASFAAGSSGNCHRFTYNSQNYISDEFMGFYSTQCSSLPEYLNVGYEQLKVINSTNNKILMSNKNYKVEYSINDNTLNYKSKFTEDCPYTIHSIPILLDDISNFCYSIDNGKWVRCVVENHIKRQSFGISKSRLIGAKILTISSISKPKSVKILLPLKPIRQVFMIAYPHQNIVRVMIIQDFIKDNELSIVFLGRIPNIPYYDPPKVVDSFPAYQYESTFAVLVQEGVLVNRIETPDTNDGNAIAFDGNTNLSGWYITLSNSRLPALNNFRNYTYRIRVKLSMKTNTSYLMINGIYEPNNKTNLYKLFFAKDYNNSDYTWYDGREFTNSQSSYFYLQRMKTAGELIFDKIEFVETVDPASIPYVPAPWMPKPKDKSESGSNATGIIVGSIVGVVVVIVVGVAAFFIIRNRNNDNQSQTASAPFV